MPMRLWLNRTAEVSLREQLITQVVLSILCHELAPGQRLPSTRELARRFRLHPNTVSAGYKQLEKSNWLEFRKGSGVYVRPTPPENQDAQAGLDRLIAEFFRSARKLNAPLGVVRERLRQWVDIQPPDHFLLIEPDMQLAQIVVSEMKAAVSLPVKAVSEIAPGTLAGAIPVVLSASSKKLKNLGSLNGDLLTLHLRSARESLASYLPVIPSILIGIASGWPPFVKNASTMLVSAGFHPDCLLLRDTGRSNWKRGLHEAAAVVCDSVTATALDGHRRVLTFPLLSSQSLDQLRHYEELVRDPLRT